MVVVVASGLRCCCCLPPIVCLHFLPGVRHGRPLPSNPSIRPSILLPCPAPLSPWSWCAAGFGLGKSDTRDPWFGQSGCSADDGKRVPALLAYNVVFNALEELGLHGRGTREDIT